MNAFRLFLRDQVLFALLNLLLFFLHLFVFLDDLLVPHLLLHHHFYLHPLFVFDVVDLLLLLFHPGIPVQRLALEVAASLLGLIHIFVAQFYGLLEQELDLPVAHFNLGLKVTLDVVFELSGNLTRVDLVLTQGQ